MNKAKKENIVPRPVQIQASQEKHFKRVLEILSREYGYLDVSPLGSGKTHITFAVAATFGLNIMVIGQKSALDNWNHWGKIYGVHIIGIMTYQSLRGQSGQVNHELLRIENGEYVATELFEQCVMSGLLLVFDEYHNVKNDNTQLASAHALVKSLVRLVRMGYKARIALLSGTPCEMKEYVTSTFMMLGIVLSDKLYNFNRSSKKYELIGIQEAINKCNEYNPDETLAISCRPVNKTTAKTICYDLYVKVLKHFLVSSMPPPSINVEKNAKNLYALMPDQDVERLKKGILLFKSATNYRHEIQEIDLSGVNWGDVTTSRMEIDSSKIPTVCRLAQQDLIRDPKCKVLIYCTYTRDMKTAAHLLARYNPLVMDGSTSAKKRAEMISSFQEDTSEFRVFISNPKVGGIGIDLDDKFGTRPRIMYILPSYFFTDQYQATGRIYRAGTKSNATIYFVYSRAFPYETGILNSMANKSQVVKNMVTEEQSNIKFPGEYDEILELTEDEIKTGITKNMEQNTDEIPPMIEPVDERPYAQTRKLYNMLSNKPSRSDLEEDKFHAYGLFLEEIDKGSDEITAIANACTMMDENVRERMTDDMQMLTQPADVTQYTTEDQMIRFIEAYII